jgi:membrane associated rhomboid family serine protease
MMDQAVCCYRHPDRETGIRCTRCERPICPECMVSASVGFQCPECVRGSGPGAGPGSGPGGGATRQGGQWGGPVPGRRGPRPRTVTGGTVTSDPRLVTKILIGLNVAVLLIGMAVGIGTTDLHLSLYALCDPHYSPRCIGVSAGPSQWYRLLTSAFLHDSLQQNPTHLLFNMLALWWIGGPLEALLGRLRYLALYLLAALGGSAFVLLFAPGTPTLGASGAIFGLFGATAVFVRRLRLDMRPVLILLALNLGFSFAWANVSWQAHIGGLITGTLVAIGMAYAPPGPRRNTVQWGSYAVVLALVVLTTAVAVLRVRG